MTIRKAFGEGIRQANRSFLAVLILFAVNFIFAGITALLFRSVVTAAFGDSLAPERLVQDFDFTIYIDFLMKNAGKLSSVYMLIMWFMVLSNFLSAFLDGGIIAAVQLDAERFRLKSFFASCGEFFGRFLRLFLIFVFAVGLCGILLAFLSVFLYSIILGDGETEIQILQAAVGAMFIFLVPLSVVFLASDYARVVTVIENERRMFRSFWHGIRFVFKKFLKTYGLFLLCFILTVLLFVCWAALTTQVVVNSGLMVFGIFLIQQIIVLGRAWVRVVAIGGQVTLYSALKPMKQEELPPAPAVQGSIEKKPEQIPIPLEVQEEKGTVTEKKKTKLRVPKKRVRVKTTKRRVKRVQRRVK